MSDFIPFPKIPRLYKNIVITEKIDGTNGQIIVCENGAVMAASKNRILSRENDNYGFGKWVESNSTILADMLGVGAHPGEWWGKGIQRGYGVKGRCFSLFNTTRWSAGLDHYDGPAPVGGDIAVVPVLWSGDFCDVEIRYAMETLAESGSCAAPGFMDPEGVIVFMSSSGDYYKVPFDSKPKDSV
jgi:hypothetical protein